VILRLIWKIVVVFLLRLRCVCTSAIPSSYGFKTEKNSVRSICLSRLPPIAHSIDVRLLRDAAGRSIGVISSPVRKQGAKVAPSLARHLDLSHLGRLLARSVHPSTADIRRLHRHVRFVPMAEVTALFDHLVGAGEQRWRYGEAERLRSLEVDHQFELGRLHDWQIGRLLALEYTTSITTNLEK
jgi:hypothetical protein